SGCQRAPLPREFSGLAPPSPFECRSPRSQALGDVESLSKLPVLLSALAAPAPPNLGWPPRHRSPPQFPDFVTIYWARLATDCASLHDPNRRKGGRAHLWRTC